jgi:hypothetical protein
MNQETITYLTNTTIGVILALLMTLYWRQQKGSSAISYWVLAAWVMTVADVMFAARPWLPHAWGRLLPTLSVTAGHVVLLLGAQHTAGMTQTWRRAGVLLAVHAAVLVAFLIIGQSSWRMVANGVVWGGLSVASAWCLRQASHHFWHSIAAPASAFLMHGIFHAVRVALAILFEAQGWTEATVYLKMVGDFEVSFFMVALFVGLLVAHLQLRHEELMSARAEVETLSGLLPICAWCKKVRDDNGYWQQVEKYFTTRSGIRFTHGMCVECIDAMGKEQQAAK